jgi:nitrogen fixation NifU-like protein
MIHDPIIEDLYQEIILDHYRAPRHRGSCAHCGRTVHRDNPLCGDEVTVGLDLSDGTIARVSFEGHGCSISQASASMMAEAVVGVRVERAMELAEAVRQLMHGDSPDEDLGDLMALSGVARFPVRIKCALLPWTALVEALS